MSSRTFTDSPAVREQTPVLVGLVSPSGAGKTYSALRLATGMQRVTGGDIFVVDTEQKRALHYAQKFRFRHVPFGKPFSPLDYLQAIDHCVTKGAKIVIVDSMSHEHEGPGGVLEMHSAKLDKLAGSDWKKRERCTMLAWAEPKQQRRRLLNSIVQMDCNFIFCFRAKRKIKPQKGGEPVDLGWMPIGGEEFVYEMTLNAVLHPGANGIPTWDPQEVGEREMVKMPDQFREVFTSNPQLSEDVGERLARWAAGGTSPSLTSRYEMCPDQLTWERLEAERMRIWKPLPGPEKLTLKAASDAAQARIAADQATAVQPAADDGEANTMLPGSTDISDEEKRELERMERGGR